MLTCDVELLTGVYRAKLPEGGLEWPPHPDRLYSALVQAWGDGGRVTEEREALEWLEALEPPEIEASGPGDFQERDAPTVYVPPNDMRGNELTVLPDRRLRQARSFGAVVPADRAVRFRWKESPPEHLRPALASLATRVASVGHSASLARCSFDWTSPARTTPAWAASEDGDTPVRLPYAGRLKDLERWFSTERGKKRQRPQTRRTSRYTSPLEFSRPIPPSYFGGPSEWFVFEHEGGFRPDILGFAHVARRVRDALMSLGPQPSPEIITGHGAPDAPSQRPHLAIVPLSNVGWMHSNGDLVGFAIVLPREFDPQERTSAVQAVSRMVRFEEGNALIEVHLTDRQVWKLRRLPSGGGASLSAHRWCESSRIWASATPVLLDRFPEKGDVAEEARIVAAACAHIGLPEPVEIELHKHSALTGAASCYPERGVRHRPTWSFPRDSKLANRPRRHVVLRFADPVRGPILIGAGRYHGFGHCLPISGVTPP